MVCRARPLLLRMMACDCAAVQVPAWQVPGHLSHALFGLKGSHLSGIALTCDAACSVLGAQVTHHQRRSVLVDLLTVYGAGGKAIVFCERKRDADEVAAAVALSLPCEVRQCSPAHICGMLRPTPLCSSFWACI